MFRGKSLKHGSTRTADKKVRYEPKRFISHSFLYYIPLFENRRVFRKKARKYRMNRAFRAGQVTGFGRKTDGFWTGFPNEGVSLTS